MRISDWSSDVCSSDLFLLRGEQRQRAADIPGPDQSDFLASHGARHSLPGKPGNASQTGGITGHRPPAKDWRRPYADSLKETTAKRMNNCLYMQIDRNIIDRKSTSLNSSH